jgi:ABC-type transport system substrate-binding protein
VVSSFVNNDRIVFTPNKNYTGPGGPYLAKVTFAWYADPVTEAAAAARGDTDITQDYTLANVKALKQSKNYTTSIIPAYEFEHLELNVDPTYNGAKNPLHNLKVRQALALDTDKVGLISSALDVSKGVAKNYVQYSPLIVTPKFSQPYGDKAIQGQWDPIAKKYEPYGSKAVADAKTLLKEAGYPGGGFSLDVYSTTAPVRASEYSVYAKDWSNIGVKTSFHPIDSTIFFSDWDKGSQLNHGAFQVAMFAFSLSNPDPDGIRPNLDSNFIDRDKKGTASDPHATVNANYSGIKNKTIDKELTIGEHSTNKKTREKAYTIVQTEVVKNAYWIPLFNRPEISTYDKHVGNYKSIGLSESPQWNSYEWKYLQ